MLQRLCFFINLSLHNSLSFSAGFLLTYIRKKSIIIELEIMVFLHGWNLVLGIISLFWLMYWIRHTQQFMSHYSLLPSSKVIHTDINLMMASREFVRLKVGSKKATEKTNNVRVVCMCKRGHVNSAWKRNVWSKKLPAWKCRSWPYFAAALYNSSAHSTV